VRLKTEIEEVPYLVGVCHRVAAENAVFQNARKRPRCAAIGGISPAALPEIRGNIIELPPGDCHLVPVGRINGNHALVRGIADDVLAVLIDVDLETDVRAELRDHSRRRLYLPWWCHRGRVKFQLLVPW